MRLTRTLLHQAAVTGRHLWRAFSRKRAVATIAAAILRGSVVLADPFTLEVARNQVPVA